MPYEVSILEDGFWWKSGMWQDPTTQMRAHADNTGSPPRYSTIRMHETSGVYATTLARTNI
jgi:hypothetical protein